MAGIKLLYTTQLRGFPDGTYTDGGNLYFRVRGKSRSWVFRFKVPQKATWAKAGEIGKPVEMGLGAFPARGLEDARKVAEVARGDLANDRDPRQRFKVEVAPSDKPTFKTYADDYIRDNEGGWRNPKHKQQWRNTIVGDAAYAKPLWDKRPGDITVSDIHKLLSPLWATKTETATRLRQRVETVIDYAFVLEEIDRRNPARWKGNLDKVLTAPRKQTKVKNFAAPNWRLVPEIMAKLREKPDVMSALAMRFSILTAARSTEVRDSTWDEIDFDAATWTLPEARTKNEQLHVVPLNAEAVEILTGLKAKADPEQPRVFPGAKGGLLSDVAVNKVLHAAMPGITAHGIARSSFRTWASEATEVAHIPGAVAEAALNHKQRVLEATYNRTTYFDKRVELMSAWHDFLAGKDNVVQLGLAKTG